MILIIILYIICASMFTISKFVLGFAEPIFFVAIRMICAGTLLIGYYFIKHKSFNKQFISAILKDWSLFTKIILFHIYITYICDLCALKNLTSAESAFIYNLSPFISAIFSFFWFSEIMTFKKMVGLLIGFSSLIPIVNLTNEHLPNEHYNTFFLNQKIGSMKIVPIIITFIAVISSSYGWIILRELVKYKNYSPIFVNGIGMFFGGLIAFITSLFTENWNPIPVNDLLPFIKGLLLIIVVANLFFYNLYGYLLNYYTATFLSFAGILCPIFTAILSNMILGETLSPNLVISGLISIIGLFIFYQQELLQGYIKK